MGPKAPKGSQKKKADVEKDDVLQAVIVADTFESRLAPFTLDRPKCLLPLANVPLIEYTLDYLTSCGTQEVFLYPGAHSDQVEAYLNASKWKGPLSPFKKFTILKTNATSVGDIMRDLDQKDLMTGDFITVSGDIVSNFPIEAALKKHKARREKDKNAIMTMLLQQTTSRDRVQGDSLTPTFVIDPTKDRCLHYEESRLERTSGLLIDPETLDNAEIDIRQDLIDCRIDICTPDVLSLWSDNFDNQAPRKDFLYGVLKDYELNGKTVHTYIVEDHYAARVSNMKSYETISKDVISRRTYPYCPDTNIFPEQYYTRSKSNVYQEDGVILARSARIERGSVVGRGTSLGDGSVVKNSVVGRNCQIGKNVEVVDSYIWDHATIGNDVKILKAIIASEATIGDKCLIEEGARVSFGKYHPAGTSVPKSTDDTIDDSGYASSISSDSYADEDAEVEAPSRDTSRRESRMSDAGSDGGITSFHHDAFSTLYDRMQAGAASGDCHVELLSLRLAHNASDDQVRRAVATAMMRHIQKQIDTDSTDVSRPKKIEAITKSTITTYRDLIKRQQSSDTEADQVDFLLQVQKDLMHRSDGPAILGYVARYLYELDIFEEDVFTAWWTDEASTAGDGMESVRQATQAFIEWLQNAESESGEEDEC